MTTKAKYGSLGVVLVVLVLAIAGALFWFLSQKKTTITVLGEKLNTTSAMESIVNEYEKERHGTIHVKFVTEDYVTMDRLASDDLANKTAVYDLILQYNTALYTYVREKYVYTLQDLEDPNTEGRLRLPEMSNDVRRLENDLFPRTWREVGFYKDSNGKYAPVAIPFSANTMLLCYNKRLFNDPRHRAAYEAKYHEPLAPPRTWRQFENIAQYFQNPPYSYGLVMQGDKYWIYYEWVNFAFGMGGGVMQKDYGWDTDATTPLILTKPETIDATNLYQRLLRYNASGDFFNTDNYKQRDRMKKGDVAMAIMWSDVLYDFVQSSEPGKLDDRFGFEPIPGEKSLLAGGSFYINRNSKHVKEVEDFMLWLTEPSQQAKLLSRGLCSPSRGAYDDPQAKALPYVDALHRSLERGVYMMEAGPDADAIEVKISDELQRMFREKLTAQHVLTETEQDVDATRREIFRQLKK
ncbi:MAG TPA: extracellular solute-binding protein [Terriglobales bacterium]|nr:extracellular solute-binding protein [Terriglobales bacterium]